MVRSDAEQDINPDDDPRPFSRYGTTLLTALSVRRTLLLSQLGDGAVLVVWPDGTVETPFPGEIGVGVETWSMSSAGSPRLWQTAALDCAKEALILLATDGLVNAFVDKEQLHRFARSLAERVRDYDLGRVVPPFLHGWTVTRHAASGDDITLVLARVLAQPAPSESVGAKKMDDQVIPSSSSEPYSDDSNR